MTEADAQATRSQILQLVARAKERGEPDVFPGKRGWSRYRLATRLEVTTDITSRADPAAATMHNVSEGGIGLWSKEKIAAGSMVWIREWSPKRKADWVPAYVRHCSLGIGGYLIGAAFNRPLPAKKPPEPDGAHCSATPRDIKPPLVKKKRAARRSLRTQCAFVAVVSSALGTLMAVQQYWALQPAGPLSSPAIASIALAAAASGLAVWLFLGRHARSLGRLRTQIQQMADGTYDTAAPAVIPSAELAAVQQALVGLTDQWRKRESSGVAQRARLEELNLIKSNILNMVSHDLRTPLTSILLYAEMLREELETLKTADQQHFLEIICGECKRLSHLVGDLLEAQRMESGRCQWQMQPVDIAQAVAACALVFQAMAQGKSIQLSIECPDSLPHIEADGDRISQVLNNLVSNAIKYSPAGSWVRISAEAGVGEVVICVADNGPGIPREKWDQIFERFSQVSVSFIREIPGVGLGLYIVRQIVERHGGRVWVDSEVGRGTAFYVSLPVEAPAGPQAAPEQGGGTRGRVVVCDADPELACRIGQTLRERGFEVRLAHSACRLLAHLDQVDVDIVVTDVLLPDMNAAELLEALSDVRGRSFKVIAHTYAGDGSQLRRRGVDIYVERPATVEELLQAVEVAAKKRSAARTVLVIAGPDTDLQNLVHAVSARGDVPLSMQTLESAARLIRDYPVDCVLISDQVLTPDWSELENLRPALDENTQVVVICEQLHRKQRRLADRLGVTATSRQAECDADTMAAIAGTPNEQEPNT